ncbi:MAG: molybdopterin-guanine dinucleotide biosynthesis protein B [Dictyoglomaceae bacterium]
MSKIVSFIGSSGSGKTSLIEKLLEFSIEEDLKVGVIKHTQEGFEVEEPGKDSARFKLHGARRVAVFSKGEKVIFIKGDISLQDFIFEFFEPYDLIFLEGFKSEKGIDKILVIRNPKEIKDFDLSEVIAVFSFKNFNLDIDKPFFKEGSIRELWEFIKKLPERKVKLYVNGEEVSINSFVENLFYNMILSMVKSLKIPSEEVETIEIKWKNS